jgi:hypothetical protein
MDSSTGSPAACREASVIRPSPRWAAAADTPAPSANGSTNTSL